MTACCGGKRSWNQSINHCFRPRTSVGCSSRDIQTKTASVCPSFVVKTVISKTYFRAFLFTECDTESRRIHSRVCNFVGAVEFGCSKGRACCNIGCQSQC